MIDHTRQTSRGALFLALVGIGLGVTMGLTLSVQVWGDLTSPGGLMTFVGRITAMAGTYLLLVELLLTGRLPAVERALGQDRLVRWHRLLGPWVLILLAAHAVATTIGFAQSSRTGWLHEAVTLLTTFPGILAATVGLGLLLMAGVTSYRFARRRMSYETWWAVHLYSYLGAALSFSHQLATGSAFLGHPAARAFWTGLWIVTAGLVILYRFGLPLALSLRHRLRVEAVVPEGPGLYSIICRGHRLDRLHVAGGQFFQWRILRRGLWWQAHPYSISALPTRDHLRFTVKVLGDHSEALTRLRPGTPVAIEGPYGTFTKYARQSDRVLLVGAGAGITPVRALLEDLPGATDVDVILRASTAAELVHRREVAAEVARRRGRLYELTGPRAEVDLGPGTLLGLVPDVAARDVYICGPHGLIQRVAGAARALGVADERLHREEFEF